jgi:hypothetical protein
MTDRKKEYDCQCDYCKKHICELINVGGVPRCGHPKCENNIKPKKVKCHDCGVEEGDKHKDGCDMERCPFCGGQLISCDCCYDKLGIRNNKLFPNTDGLPAEIYEYGLSDKQEEEYDKILEKKGRIPFIDIPFFCARCGNKYPELFHATDWMQIIPKDLQDKVLCEKCYNIIKGWMKK